MQDKTYNFFLLSPFVMKQDKRSCLTNVCVIIFKKATASAVKQTYSTSWNSVRRVCRADKGRCFIPCISILRASVFYTCYVLLDSVSWIMKSFFIVTFIAKTTLSPPLYPCMK
jgi:hypothetical protein